MDDTVVPLQAASGKRPRRRRRRPSRTALVLGGGGVTGAVYEIGALRALDLLSENSSVGDFDVYVGTSAGAIVASMLAAGVSPEELMRVVDREPPVPFGDVQARDVLRPNLRGYAASAVQMPWQVARAVRDRVAAGWSGSLLDVVMGVAGGMPSGLYSGRGLEDYLARILAEPGRTDDFRELPRELLITATDLDAGERVVFGAGPPESGRISHVPISRAVRASAALPMVYAPVRVDGRDLVDGGLVSTTNLDLAVDAGAELVVVVNPLVPGVPGGQARIRDGGMAAVGMQTFKLMAHQRLHELARQWEARYPGVDIVLIEPDPSDALMASTSIMDMTKRREIARHGFESVTRKLHGDYADLEAVAARHGLRISESRLRKITGRLERDTPDDEGDRWRRLLGQARSSLLRQAGVADG